MERLIVVDSSSWFSDTRESTPASAGAERQTRVFECAVRTLCSASDVSPSAALLKHHHPNQSECNAANTRRSNRKFDAYAIGCRQGEIKEERVYTLPRVWGFLNELHLCTCTNEPSGEDLCTR